MYDYADSEYRNIASFKYINDAKVLTDILDNIEWDLDKINSDAIYCSKGYFWKLKNNNNNIKIIGKYLISIFKIDIINTAYLKESMGLSNASDPLIHVRMLLKNGMN